MSATMPLRALRAAAFAAVSVLLGIAAHTFAGGSVSTPSALLALLLAFLPAHALAGRERSLGVILATLAASQAVLHVLFSTAHAVEPVAVAHGHGQSGLVPGLGMLVMHGWAVGLTALWLSHGERAIWALLRRLAVRLLFTLLAFVDPAGRTVLAAPAATPVIPRWILLGHDLDRRGPPGVTRTVTA
ncbi:MFS transporter [Nonomuraea sp. NPDC059194]|uniref:MFS transporter n=1 Tax=Nonomuraea sp. NPDC059194 TaxID=3346764 RepID=UPI0036ADED90